MAKRQNTSEQRSASLKESRRIDELMRKATLGGSGPYVPSEYLPAQEATFPYRFLGFRGDVAELDFEHLCSAFRVRAIQCVDDWTLGDEEEKEAAELRYWLLEGALAEVIRERGWERREIKARILPPFDPDYERISHRPVEQYAEGALEDVKRLYDNLRSGFTTKLIREQTKEALEIVDEWFPPETWTPEESWREAALDPYDVLGVPRGSSMDRVTKNYKKLINKAFAQLKRSRDVRESERLRRIYDSAYDKIELVNRRRK